MKGAGVTNVNNGSLCDTWDWPVLAAGVCALVRLLEP